MVYFEKVRKDPDLPPKILDPEITKRFGTAPLLSVAVMLITRYRNFILLETYLTFILLQDIKAIRFTLCFASFLCFISKNCSIFSAFMPNSLQ
jgi:hypothetical protein